MKQRFSATVLLLFILASVQDCFAQATYTVTISVKDAFCVDASNGSAKVLVKGDTTSLSYLWSNGQTQQEATGLSAGTYTLTLSNASNKDSSFFILIKERTCDPAGSLVFTPNGDGIADEWDIAYLDLYPNFQLLIYNRWGQKVYEQEKHYEKWDGRHNGLPLPDATYYYVIKKNRNDSSEGVVKGSVSIVR